MKRPLSWLLILGLPAVFLLPFLSQFSFTAFSNYSDLAISHYPNAVFLLRSIREYHQLPLWSPTILSGYPFAADPLSGLWYLPGWFALLFPLPLGLNIVAILHMVFGGVGMALFLRDQRLDWPAAVVGGLVFETLPRFFGHFASGHLTFVYAIAWTPWLLLGARINANRPLYQRINWSQGIIFGFIVLADIRWAAYAGLLWVCYRLYLSIRGRRHLFSCLMEGTRDLMCQVGLALLLAAPLLLPLLEYIHLSTRQLMKPEDALYLSLPPARLFGLFIPSIDGNTEFTVYPGAFAAVSFLWISFHNDLRKIMRFWVWVVVVSMLFALGSSLPGMQYLVQLPGFQLLRVPARFVLLSGFALAVLAASMFQSFLSEASLESKASFFSRLVVAGLMGFTAIAVIGIWVLGNGIAINLIWGSAACSLVGALIFIRDRRLLVGQGWIIFVFLVILVDSPGINSFSVYFRAPEEVLSQGKDAASYLRQQGGNFRVYTPSYSIPQQTAASAGLDLVNGIDPLQLSAYATFIEKASGIPSNGYDVVLPPLGNADICCGNAGYIPDAHSLGLLNVKYVASEFDLSASGLKKIARFGKTRLYQNQEALPRAWVQPVSASAGERSSPVTDITLTPNQVQLSASGPGLLVLSEIVYPGWRVTVDGKEGKMVTVAGLLRGVVILSGQHSVQYGFYPKSVFMGVGLCIMGWVFLAGYMFLTKKGRL